MKMQTSMEFLIIASAIGILILAAITQYGKDIAPINSIISPQYPNYTAPQSLSLQQNPRIIVSIPVNSTAYGQNIAQVAAYGCNDGIVNASLNSSGLIFSRPLVQEDFYGAGEWIDQFYANPGINLVHVSYEMECNGSSYSGSEYLYTVSSASGNVNSYSAYISKRNESVVYAMENQSISSIHQSSHCTYLAFNDRPYGIQSQCGDSSWGYMVFSSDCYQRGSLTDTVCINPSSSGYNLLSASQSPIRYAFSINLSVNDGAALQSTLTNGVNSSPLLLDGRQVGNSTVINVSSSQVPSEQAAISGANGFEYPNSTYLNGYYQALNNMESSLGYYNGTEVSSDIETELNQTIYAYQNAEDLLLSSSEPMQQNRCVVRNSTFVCPATYPFYYIIDVNASPAYVRGNESLDYAGSVIRVYS